MGRIEGLPDQYGHTDGRRGIGLPQSLERGKGFSHREVENRDTTHVSLYPPTHRGAHLHLLRGSESLQGTGDLLKLSDIKMSVDKVRNMAKTVTTISVYMPQNKMHLIKTMPMKRHKPIAKLFEKEFWEAQ